MTSIASTIGQAERLALLIQNIQSDIAQKEQSVTAAADSIIRRMEHVKEAIASGVTINSLGELQGSAALFDILCAERQNLVQQLKMLTWAATDEVQD